MRCRVGMGRRFVSGGVSEGMGHVFGGLFFWFFSFSGFLECGDALAGGCWIAWLVNLRLLKSQVWGCVETQITVAVHVRQFLPRAVHCVATDWPQETFLLLTARVVPLADNLLRVRRG